MLVCSIYYYYYYYLKSELSTTERLFLDLFLIVARTGNNEHINIISPRVNACL